MRIATYNLRKGGPCRVHWLRMIEGHGVDLLLTQESYAPHEHLPPGAYPDVPRQSAWKAAGQNRWGSAVFACGGSVRPLAVRDFAGWVTAAEVSGTPWQGAPADPLLVFSVHAPAGLGGYWGQVHRLLDRIARLVRGREVIIGGDFNVAVSHHPGGERPAGGKDLAIQARLAGEFGLMNCWQSANPGRAPCQTLRWSGDRHTPYHCDGLFVPASWRQRLQSCAVLAGGEWDVLSDHNPVVAHFATATAAAGAKRACGAGLPALHPLGNTRPRTIGQRSAMRSGRVGG